METTLTTLDETIFMGIAGGLILVENNPLFSCVSSMSNQLRAEIESFANNT